AAGLALWRGSAAEGVDSRTVRAAAVRLDEERLVVTEEYIQLELELGRHQLAIGELRQLTADYPLREKLYAYLMAALYRSGRQAEALEVYRAAHRTLVDEYGVEPGAELRSLELAILNNDPNLRAPAKTPDRLVPRQVPGAPAGVVGRDEVLEQIRLHLVPARVEGVAAVAMSGPGGVGKTALALRVAHAVEAEFPDGQLYAQLLGAEARPRTPEDVLEEFLVALGVPPALLPSGLSALSSLYRSRLAGQRILVVLDDAAGADQVRPLLPGDPGCALLVTSRRPLPGLPGARHIDLGVLEPRASLDLLSDVIGEARVAAELSAAAQLAELCGHLPLALWIAAAKLSTRRHWPVARMVTRLRDEHQRLDELTLGGVGIRTNISMSYGGLAVRARRLLLLLGTLGAADFAGWVAGPLASADAVLGADLLEELVEARLVEASINASGQTRYRLHELIRIFVQEEVVAGELAWAERAEAQRRMLRGWLHLARHAHRRVHGGDFTVLRSPAVPWVLPEDAVQEAVRDPFEWFERERGNLISAVYLASQLGQHDICWELAMSAVTFFESRADRDDWRETHEIAAEAARRAGDERGEAAMRYSRAALALVEQRLDDAQRDLEPALAWFEAAGDVHGRGLALRHLAFIDRLQGRNESAARRLAAALVDLRRVGDAEAEAHSLNSLAQMQMDAGRHDEAERLLREASRICEKVGTRRVAAQVQHRLGQLYLERGDLAAAEAAATAVLRAATEMRDPIGIAYALLGIGEVALARGDLDPARVAMGEALETMRRTGHRLGVGQILLRLAELALIAGEDAGARAHLDEVESLMGEIGVANWRPRVWQLRGRLAGPPGAERVQ
ncbi:MAG: tetratricopeptide repeat protein, partial [Micromonosporaceae bacterium]|nr:tetratricopeptide repeat protein [Micromonosporaceae bacterium]